MADRTCTVAGCVRPRRARGWCKHHWQRWSRTGDVHLKSAIRDDLTARLLALVEIDLPHECWPFRSVHDKDGYGRLVVAGRGVRAHRLTYELLVGPIPPGLLVLHTCDNPPCCNPAHLFVGTQGDNMRDKCSKGRARNGHTGKLAAP